MQKTKRFILLFVAFSFLVGPRASEAIAKKNLRIGGNVIGHSLPGRYFSMFSYNTLLVRVQRVFKGREKSRHLKVRFVGISSTYVPSNFCLENSFEFQLKRTADCDGTYGRLTTLEVMNENGVTEKWPALTFVPGVEKDFLAEDTLLPCYSIS